MDFFQTWYVDRDYLVLHFGISLDDLDLQSRSQLYEKSKTSASIFSQILSMDLDEIQYVATTC